MKVNRKYDMDKMPSFSGAVSVCGGQVMPFWFCRAVLAAAAVLLFSSLNALAIEDSGLFDLSLEELSKVEVKSDIASIRAKPIREQPGIVSVITAAQIREIGARDLSDVLMLVPGFALDTDVQSMVGLTFRGLQGQEGKVLLIVDGIEVNESLYGSLPILNHIPAEAIQQVEIIRGPGSAMYGGTAGLSVVRVTTKAAGRTGGYAVFTPSYVDGDFTWNYGFGLTFAEGDWRLALNSSYSDGFISNRKYTSLEGTTLDMTDLSGMYVSFIDLGIGYRALDIRLVLDLYRYRDAIYFGEPTEVASRTSFDSFLASVKYGWKLNNWLEVTPQFTYREQDPWNAESEELGNWYVHARRYQFEVNSIAELSHRSSVMLGARYQRDSADEERPESYEGHGDDTITSDDIAGYAQYDLDTKWVSVSAGVRYEDHDAVGGDFVPRIALTKAWDAFHIKALYSEAFRTPGLYVAKDAIGGVIDAEHTVNYELEGGYRFSDAVSWVANLFYMKVDQPILYDSGGSGDADDGYYNGTTRLSAYGLETELRLNLRQVSTLIGYSLYTADDNDIDYVRGDAGRFLAAPAHKIVFSGTWRIARPLSWNLNGFWLSKRLAYVYPGDAAYELDTELIINSFLEYRINRYSFGLGVANLLDEDRWAAQPYAGGSGPVPLKGREIFVRLSREF